MLQNKQRFSHIMFAKGISATTWILNNINLIWRIIMKHLALATLIITSFGLTGTASAENGHAYNGSYCNSYYGNQASYFNSQYNGIRNTTNVARYISCPVVVDEIANTSGTTRVYVHYTGSGTIKCGLYSMYGAGAVKQSKWASRSGTGWVYMPNLTTDDYWGSYSMHCLVPANGTVNTIWLGER